MKSVSLLLLAVVAGFATLAESAPAAEDRPRVDRTAVKEARSWVKKDLKQRRAALSILKRVKDEKSAEKAGKSLMKLYAEPRAKSTAMGTAAPESRPAGEEMDEALEKSKKALEKVQEDIDEQLERIEKLNLESSTLKSGLEKLNEHGSELML